MKKNKAIFLDRDGVLNVEIGDYVYQQEKFIIPADVPEGLRRLKAAGYILVVVTNQGGIAKGLYTEEVVKNFHQHLQERCNHVVDALYFAPWHVSVSDSLMRKPNSLMLEKAIARFNIDPTQSYIIGDAERDLKAGAAVGVKGVLIPSHKEQDSPLAVKVVKSFSEFVDWVLGEG